jgi:hypothetical protein
MLFTGGVKVSRQNNHHLDNTTLVVGNAQPHDAGAYTCRVMIRARDEISVTHRLIVNTLSFQITPVSHGIPCTPPDSHGLLWTPMVSYGLF